MQNAQLLQLKQAIVMLRSFAIKAKVKTLQKFFRTEAGDYGEGDVFIGVNVPNIRLVAKYCTHFTTADLTKLIRSPIHEERFLALVILIEKFTLTLKYNQYQQARHLKQFYLKNLKWVNNWDLVDVSASKILGAYLLNCSDDYQVLTRLSSVKHLWSRRVAMVATHAFIKAGQFDLTFELSIKLFNDNHDLIHKATGWMLREVGKQNTKALISFLKIYKSVMPRTCLRYAVERFSEPVRKSFLFA